MNKDYIKRDMIIFGGYDRKSYMGGCKNFHCSYATMEKLVEENFIELDECQNYSPYTRDFMDVLKDVDNVEFTGYAISPDREDYRVTIDGVDVEIQDTDFDTVSILVESFRGADEFSLQHDGHSYYLHAWWD